MNRPHRPRPARAEPARERAPSPPRGDSEILYGLRAGEAIFARRRGDILRIAHAATLRREIEPMLRWAASQGLAVSELPERELERIAETKNHEGLVLDVRARKFATPNELADALIRANGVAVALDRVRNPYNVGAILRSAAFFGVDAALLGAPAPHPALAPDAVRVSEGGSEHLLLSRTTDLADTLGRLRTRGVRVVGADGHARTSAIGFAFERPTVLVLGNEREGVDERVRQKCDALVAIPGSGAVESLNVAVAAGVLVAELVRGRTLAAAR